MSAVTLVHIITDLAFILLAGLALIDFLHCQDWFRADVALVFTDLALVALIQLITLYTGWNSSLLNVTSGMLLVAHPYLLLRMVRHFRPVSRWVQWFAVGGLLFTWLGIVGFSGQLPNVLALLIIAYFLMVEAYNTLAFFQDASRSGGVTRRRLYLASFGTATIGAIFVITGIDLLNPAVSISSGVTIQGLGTVSIICYFLSFAPPRWLRHSWQERELREFLKQSAGLRGREQRMHYLRQLCQTVMETVGGVEAQLALWSPEHADLVVQQSVFSSAYPSPGQKITIDLQPYWQANRPAVIQLQPGGSQPGALISTSSGVEAAYVLPVANLDKNWGVLLIYLMRSPVFAQDDLDLLTLYTEQAAISLTYEAMLAEQTSLIGELNTSQAQLQRLNEELKQEIIERQRAEKEREKAIREQAAREEAELARQRFAFLAKASQVLSSSLDEREILVSFAHLAVPEIADGCEVDIIEPDLVVKAVEFADIDPSKAEKQRKWRQMHPIDAESPVAVAEVARTGVPKLYSALPEDDFLQPFARSAEEMKIIQELGYRSAVVMPLRSRGRPMGVALFTTSSSDRCYTSDDLSFFQDLSNRVGLALDNAALFASAQREINDRVQVEQALRESRERLMFTTEAAGVAIWSMDFSLSDDEWDPNFKELMGLAPDQTARGLSVYDLILPEDLPRVKESVRLSVENHKLYEAEYRVPLTDGSYRWILARGRCIYDSENRPIRLVGVALDITQRKINEKRSRENLAQIEVQHRLVSQRESERRKIAQDLHDGPLQELIVLTFGLSSAVAMTEDPSLIELLEQTRQGLKNQIGELRLFASELRPPALDKFGLDKAIDSHVEGFRKKYPGIEILLDPQTRNILLPEATGVALFRIYQESMNNVVRHSQATWVRVQVGLNDHQAFLEIQDNGCGFEVPEEWLDLAHQGHLGLVGIHERAEAMGGSARIYSRPGEGTTIRVNIPISDGSPLPD